jgi:Ca2+-binding EF-hand superfamily protein
VTRRLVFGLVFLTAATRAEAQAPPAFDFHFPSDAQIARLELSAAGFAPDAAWGQFLDRWFDYFDRDGDGFLALAEAERVLALPSSNDSLVGLDFARSDANKDGKLARSELKAAMRAKGFTPVVLRSARPPEDSLRVNAVLYLHLDIERNGSLRGAGDPKRTLEMLKWDDNDDEMLTVAELLLHSPKGLDNLNSHLGVRVNPAQREKSAASTVGVKLTEGDAAASLGQRHRLGGALVTVDGRNVFWKGPAYATKMFCVAQFDTLRGERPHLTRQELERDPAAKLILALFDPADRDGNGALTPAEFRRFLDLLDEGACCQMVVTMTDRSGDLFDLLDADGNGRLDYRELSQATKRIDDLRNAKGDVAIPARVVATVQRGALAPAFGPLPLSAAPVPSALSVEAVRKGPRWFQALDRNHDGFVSPLEFVGPAHVFRRLDADSDGVISSDEAQRAASRER